MNRPRDATRRTRQIEERISELARDQHGLATRTQLVRLGLRPAQIEYRVATRRFRPLHRGVYLVGGVRTPRTREMAAILACGPGTWLSHRSAAGLWGIIRLPDSPTPSEVTVVGSRKVRRPGIRTHRVAALDDDEVDRVDGIPVTSVSRTLLDLAAVAPGRELERALARARRRDLASRDEVRSLLDRHAARRGSRALRALLEDESRRAVTRSEAEERFLDLCRRARLPAPDVNAALAGYEVDFLWRSRRVAVEVDGFAFHSSKEAFERDRVRDASLSARGVMVIRVTWRQVTEEPEALLARLAQALALNRNRGGGRRA